MLNQEDFINRLHKILEHYHLSAATFADGISVQRSSISHLLSGRNKPSLEFVLKIVDTYKEVSLEWLLYGRDHFPKSEIQKTANNATAGDLFSTPQTTETLNEEQTIEKTTAQKKTTTPSEIERIVVFYKNGTFKEYSEISS